MVDPSPDLKKTPRILIGHLTSNGDILYSSAIARQIKEVDYPGCHLTWAAGSGGAKTLAFNPYIDVSSQVIPLEQPISRSQYLLNSAFSLNESELALMILPASLSIAWLELRIKPTPDIFLFTISNTSSAN